MERREHDQQPLIEYRRILTAYQQSWNDFRAQPTLDNELAWEERLQALYDAVEQPGKFELGTIHSTHRAIDALMRSQQVAEEFLIRHKHGDFGELDPYDRWINEREIRAGGGVRSIYTTREQDKLWVETIPGWSQTILFVPEEY